MTPGIANTAKGSVYMVQMVPWVFPSSSFPCAVTFASFEGITTVPCT